MVVADCLGPFAALRRGLSRLQRRTWAKGSTAPGVVLIAAALLPWFGAGRLPIGGAGTAAKSAPCDGAAGFYFTALFGAVRRWTWLQMVGARADPAPCPSTLPRGPQRGIKPDRWSGVLDCAASAQALAAGWRAGGMARPRPRAVPAKCAAGGGARHGGAWFQRGQLAGVLASFLSLVFRQIWERIGYVGPTGAIVSRPYAISSGGRSTSGAM